MSFATAVTATWQQPSFSDVSSVGGSYASILSTPSGESHDLLAGKDITFQQNIETFEGMSFYETGIHYPQGHTGPVINGVAATEDGGRTFSYFDIGLDSTTYTARYAAFPSETTWYVTSGAFELTAAEAMRNATNVTDAWEYDVDENSRVSGLYDGRSNSSKTFVVGAISKTTDGGRNFKEIYNSNGKYVFHEIYCWTTEICMVVGDNYPNAVALRTEDGGKTWVEKLFMSGPTKTSLVACRMYSELEVWVGGGVSADRRMYGWFVHTLDGGNTWEHFDTPPEGYSRYFLLNDY